MNHIQGLGTQIVECVRIARLISKHGESFLERVYSSDEIRQCSGSKHSTQMFAALWACKEAILKMFGIEDRARFDWREVEISHRDGRHRPIFKGSLAEKSKQGPYRDWWVSYTYTRNYATATVIALGNKEDAD